MRRAAWWVLPMAILLVGCPGPEDRKKLDTIASFETFLDRFISEISPGLIAGQGFVLSEEGGTPGTGWSMTLEDYMINPLAQPTDTWLANAHFTLAENGTECSSDRHPIELYADFLGHDHQWIPYSAASRRIPSGTDSQGALSWRVWSTDSKDWLFIAGNTPVDSSGQTSHENLKAGQEMSQ